MKRYIACSLLVCSVFVFARRDNMAHAQPVQSTAPHVPYLAANIGIQREDSCAISDVLKKLLADEYVLYVKTQNYHWHVYGPHFSELHKTFGDQYAMLAIIIDTVAERIRVLGGPALTTLSDFVQHSQLKEESGVVPNAQMMIKNLLADHEAIIRSIRGSMDIVTQANDYGTESLFGTLLEKHEKTAWMLRASLEV